MHHLIACCYWVVACSGVTHIGDTTCCSCYQCISVKQCTACDGNCCIRMGTTVICPTLAGCRDRDGCACIRNDKFSCGIWCQLIVRSYICHSWHHLQVCSIASVVVGWCHCSLGCCVAHTCCLSTYYVCEDDIRITTLFSTIIGNILVCYTCGYLTLCDGQCTNSSSGDVRELIGHVIFTLEYLEWSHAIYGFFASSRSDVRHRTISRSCPSKAAGNTCHSEVLVCCLRERCTIIYLTTTTRSYRDGGVVLRYGQLTFSLGNRIIGKQRSTLCFIAECVCTLAN